MNKLYWVAGILIAIAASFVAGRMTAPTKVETITEIQWKERIVEVERESSKTEESEKENKDKMYVKIVRELPDGTKETELKVVDKGTIEIGKVAESEKERVIEKETVTVEKMVKVIEKQKPSWHISAIGMAHFPDIKEYSAKRGNYEFGLHVQRRIIGDVYVGAYGTSNRDFGLSVGISL